MKKQILKSITLLFVVLFFVSCTKSTETINSKLYKLSFGENVKMVKIPNRNYEMLATEVPNILYDFSILRKETVGGSPLYPATGVSWFGAIRFCNELSKVCRLKPVYSFKGSTNTKNWGEFSYDDDKKVRIDESADGFRLPTYDEWDYAAKAGQNYSYAGSNNIDEVAWYKGNSDGQSQPVAQKEPNAFGLYDMSGNVREWCWDEDKDNPGQRLMRLGSYYDPAYNCRLDMQFSAAPNASLGNLGFRICRTVAEKKQFKFPSLSKSSKTTIVSNDKSIKADLVGTWINKDGRWTDTLIFKKDGTFEYNGNYSYGGAEQISIGPNGNLTTGKGFKYKGNYQIIDGNILRREYTSIWRNVNDNLKEGDVTNKELRVINENEFLMSGSSTWKRQ